MLEHQSSISPSNAPSMLGSTARTNGRTYEQLLTLSGYLTLGIARRGAARFDPIGEETSPPGPAALALNAATTYTLSITHAALTLDWNAVKRAQRDLIRAAVDLAGAA